MNIEELLQETLDERATRVTGDEELAQNVMRRARGRRGRRAAVGLTALLVVVIVIVLAMAATMPRNGKVVPDPRATAVPSVDPTTSAVYRVVEGPQPIATSNGAAIGLLPRVELRGSVTWFVGAGLSVALPATVAGSRGIAATESGWVISTVSDSFTGGDTDAGAQILAVSRSGQIRPLFTGAIRSIAVSPDGMQVADVETTERPQWSVRMVARQISDGRVIRTVGLPYGQPGSWPYPSLVWTSDGIVASNPSSATSVAGATVLVQGTSITDLAPVIGVFAVPGSSAVIEVVADTDRTCVRRVASVASLPVGSWFWCGPVDSVIPLGGGLTLIKATVAGGAAPQEVWVVDENAATVTKVPVAPSLQATNLRTMVALTGTSVLVDDVVPGDWLRWDVVKNSLEVAPLPSGTNAVITW